MILDENKVLQAEVTQARVEVESILRQKLDIKNERDTLESKLAEAMLTIQQYKLNELHLMEEKAQRERDYMNQLNDFAQETKRNDQILMDEIMKRDQLIRELQSRLNQADGRKSGMEDNKMDSVSVEVDMDDESWSEDDVSCEFV
jgi:cell division septum initiation protein DivIVA